MSNELKAGVVHEAESQRQHPRVRIPATVHIGSGDDERSYRVLDVSLVRAAGHEGQCHDDHTTIHERR